MFYGRSRQGAGIDEFIERLDHYINWYAGERIKLTLGGLSSMNYKRSLGLAAQAVQENVRTPIFIWRNFKTDVGINVIIKSNLEAGKRK